LCSELRSKARCSESGVVVPEDYVDLAFKKLSGLPPKEDPQKVLKENGMMNGGPHWQETHVNDALSKLGSSQRFGAFK